MEFDGTSVMLDIIDTSGAMEFPAQQQLNMQKGQICYLRYFIEGNEWKTSHWPVIWSKAFSSIRIYCYVAVYPLSAGVRLYDYKLEV